jgi:hypothetical protein
MAPLSTLAVDAVVKILSFLDGRTLAKVTRSLITTIIIITTTLTTFQYTEIFHDYHHYHHDHYFHYLNHHHVPHQNTGPRRQLVTSSRSATESCMNTSARSSRGSSLRFA